MKYLNKLSVKATVIALIIGAFFAISLTDIAYPCEPYDGDGQNGGCIAYENAISHPGDLINNEQDSLMRLTETFLVTSLASFAALSILSLVKKRKSKSVS
jgi:hypothetical protein